jgi:3-deoxy-D-manno-octulosonate 8-phosphate phosphatase (KDO 8-P phosphatase)
MDIKLKAKLSKITTFVFDVDGVFTDATLLVGEGDVQRVFNVRDGYAVQIAIKSGYRMAVISGGKQKSIATRLSGLGVQDVYLSVGTDQKLPTLQKYMSEKGLNEEEILFIGDDIPDYLLMTSTRVLSCCPADATQEVKNVSDYISPIVGGRGAVRDVIELVMKAQGKWMKVF